MWKKRHWRSWVIHKEKIISKKVHKGKISGPEIMVLYSKVFTEYVTFRALFVIYAGQAIVKLLSLAAKQAFQVKKLCDIQLFLLIVEIMLLLMFKYLMLLRSYHQRINIYDGG